MTIFAPRLNSNGIVGNALWGSASYNPFFPTYAPPSVGGSLNNNGNCTWYAWGRFYEMDETKGYPRLSTQDAGRWYYKQDQYLRGSIPQWGAVACFGGGTFGHVAIVEEILPNGDIKCSESGFNYSGGFFWKLSYYTRTAGGGFNGYGGGSGNFLGFIYHPTQWDGSAPIDPDDGETKKKTKWIYYMKPNSLNHNERRRKRR